MNTIGATSSSYSNMTTQVKQPAPEASEVKAVARKDGDSDDRATPAAAKPAPAPTVNMNGQKLGQVINDAA
jgi:hypothetical protein